MEGPSLVIACEELAVLRERPILNVSGTALLPYAMLKGAYLKNAHSWGKHLILVFSRTQLRIHFLMFGSYRLDNPRENRTPKLLLDFGDTRLYFYSCAIKVLPENWRDNYDWTTDLMAREWNPARARAKLRSRPKVKVCDLLLDQEIFSGLGNIMKNEILFLMKMHPDTRMEQLTAARRRRLVATAENYAWKFYTWKKANVLKKNWKIMRKKLCPKCGRRVVKRITGVLQRWSHYCTRCQLKR